MSRQPIILSHDKMNLRTSYNNPKRNNADQLSTLPFQLHPPTMTTKAQSYFESKGHPNTTRGSGHHHSNSAHLGSYSSQSKLQKLTITPINLVTQAGKVENNPEFTEGGLERKVNDLIFKVEKMSLQMESQERQIKGMKNTYLQASEIRKIVEQQLSVSPTKNISKNIEQIRNQIDSIRKELSITSFKNETERRFADLDIDLKDAIKKLERSAQGDLIRATEKMLQNQKKEIESISKMFRQTMSRSQDSNSKSLIELEKSLHTVHSLINVMGPVSVAKIQYGGRAILLKYVQKFAVQNGSSKSEQITLTEKQYKLDPEGYLLDKQNRYLLNSKGQQIKLQPEHLALLKEQKMLKSY